MENPPNFSKTHHQWQIIQTTYDGAPLLIRANVTAKQWAEDPTLPIRLGFAIPLKTTLQTTQLPLPEENEQLNQIEDIIQQQVNQHAHGIHVLALTTPKMREFVFYIAPGADIKGIHEHVRNAVSTHEVQCQAVHDTTWSSYKQFTT